MARRRGDDDVAFGHLSFLDVLANSVGALTFVFLMYFVITSGLIKPTKFRLLTDLLPDARAGSRYTVGVAAAGGVNPYKWQIADGFLPHGLSLDRRQGVINGRPEREGVYRFVLRVTDSAKNSDSLIEHPFVLRVRRPDAAPESENMSLRIETDRLPNAGVGQYYDIALSATGGEEPYSWLIDGNLPPGLALEGDKITGTPEVRGEWRFKLRVIDIEGVRKEKPVALHIKAKPVLTEDEIEPLRVATGLLPEATMRKEYNLALAAGGGAPPYTWSIAKGELPAGLRLDPQTGVIKGTPERSTAAKFTVLVRDAEGGRLVSSTKDLKLVVQPLQYQSGSDNILMTWWTVILAIIVIVFGIILTVAMIIGVQCPWDKSWRCRIVGKDEHGRNIYACKHGHRFVNETKLLPEKTA